jgi:hypothetical protein
LGHSQKESGCLRRLVQAGMLGGPDLQQKLAHSCTPGDERHSAAHRAKSRREAHLQPWKRPGVGERWRRDVSGEVFQECCLLLLVEH